MDAQELSRYPEITLKKWTLPILHELEAILGRESPGPHLAQRLQTSQAWSGTQKVPCRHWQLVSVVVVQEAVRISSAESQDVRGETVSLFVTRQSRGTKEMIKQSDCMLPGQIQTDRQTSNSE